MESSEKMRSLSTCDCQSNLEHDRPSTSSMPGRISAVSETNTLQIPSFFMQSTSRSSASLSCASSCMYASTDVLKAIAAKTPAIKAADEAAQSLLPKIRHDGIQHYPFCEEYDGVSVRKTKTISESIQAILSEQTSSGGAKGKSDMPSGMSREFLNMDRGMRRIIESKVKGGASACFQIGPDKVCAGIEDIALENKGSLYSSRISVQTDFSSVYAKDEQNGIYVGSVDVKIRYEFSRQSLLVTIIKAEDVFDKSYYDFIINPFVKLGICYRSQYMENKKTRTVYRRRNPVFNEEMIIKDIAFRDLSVSQLLLQLYHKKRTGSKLLGQAYIWLDDINLTDGTEACVSQMFRAI
ncbi:hypothetical protein DPMN_008941 [Dreissena polymorpha]|uniref:C2 domain-containing protein n=1 Tax=Dreissena polymorpha TaxID=45954 RepID=A0A9D4RZL7_DREPO|nr:hypothetical protein DPMN_008941 [Dreissena polymorpha]